MDSELDHQVTERKGNRKGGREIKSSRQDEENIALRKCRNVDHFLVAKMINLRSMFSLPSIKNKHSRVILLTFIAKDSTSWPSNDVVVTRERANAQARFLRQCCCCVRVFQLFPASHLERSHVTMIRTFIDDQCYVMFERLSHGGGYVALSKSS